MFDPMKLLPIVKSSFPKGNDQQVLSALTKLGQKYPDLDGAQALAAIQKFMQEKQNPSIGMMAKRGRI